MKSKEFRFDMLIINIATHAEFMRVCFETDEGFIKTIAPPNLIDDDFQSAKQKFADRRLRRNHIFSVMEEMANFITEKIEQKENWSRAPEIYSELARSVGRQKSRTTRIEDEIKKALE